MYQNRTTLDVPQELQAKALAFARTRDQTGHVSHGEPLFAGHHHAEVRNQRGERVVGDLGPSRAQDGDQAGFACRRVADEGDVGQGLELQDDVERVAGVAEQGESGSLTSPRGQRMVAQASAHRRRATTTGLPRGHQVGDDLAVDALDHGAGRNRKDQVAAVGAVALITAAGLTVLGLAVRAVVVVQQGGRLRVDGAG